MTARNSTAPSAPYALAAEACVTPAARAARCPCGLELDHSIEAREEIHASGIPAHNECADGVQVWIGAASLARITDELVVVVVRASEDNVATR